MKGDAPCRRSAFPRLFRALPLLHVCRLWGGVFLSFWKPVTASSGGLTPRMPGHAALQAAPALLWPLPAHQLPDVLSNPVAGALPNDMLIARRHSAPLGPSDSRSGDCPLVSQAWAARRAAADGGPSGPGQKGVTGVPQVAQPRGPRLRAGGRCARLSGPTWVQPGSGRNLRKCRPGFLTCHSFLRPVDTPAGLFPVFAQISFSPGPPPTACFVLQTPPGPPISLSLPSCSLCHRSHFLSRTRMSLVTAPRTYFLSPWLAGKPHVTRDL